MTDGGNAGDENRGVEGLDGWRGSSFSAYFWGWVEEGGGQGGLRLRVGVSIGGSRWLLTMLDRSLKEPILGRLDV